MKNDVQGCRCLLHYDANINPVYADGGNLLLNLTKECLYQDMHPQHIKVLTVLLDLGMNPNLAHAKTGETALMIATSRYAYYPALVKVLLEHGADVTQVNNEGKCVLDEEYSSHLQPIIIELLNQYKEKNRQSAVR